MKGWSLFLVGAGVGAMGGVQAGAWATVPAVVAVVGGLLLLAVDARSRTRDLVGDATGARTTGARMAGGRTAGASDAAAETVGDRPSLRGLGSRVEGILGLAEEQAADRIAEAEATAARIVAQARAEAERMKTTE